MAQRDDEGLTTGRVSRAIWKLAAPILIGHSSFLVLSIVDMVFVGMLGPVAIAVVVLGHIIMKLGWILTEGVYVATATMVAQAFGAGNIDGAKRVAAQSLLLSGASYLLVGTVGFFLAGPLLSLLGATDEVISMGAPFVRLVALGSVARFLLGAIVAILRGAGEVTGPMKIFVSTMLLNIVLDPLLIFGPGFFPRLGVVGAGLASVLATAIGMIWAFYMLFSARSRIPMTLGDMRPDLPTMRDMVKLGSFQSAQAGIWTVGDAALMRIVGIFGHLAQAALGIVGRVGMTVEAINWSLGLSAQTLVGQNLGASKRDRAEQCAWLASRYGLIVALGAALVVVPLARGVVTIFTQDSELIGVAVVCLRWLILAHSFSAFTIILGSALKGAGDTRSPMVFTGLAIGLQIGLVLLLALGLTAGMSGIWAGMLASSVVQGALFVGWFRAGRWREVRLAARAVSEQAQPGG